MADYVIAPTTGLSEIPMSIQINDEYLVESSGNVSFNTTITGVNDSELVWIGVLMTANDANIVNENPQPRFASTEERFSLALNFGSNWGSGYGIAPTYPQSPQSISTPTTSAYATVEVNYDDFNLAQGGDYYNKCERIWTNGKYADVPGHIAYSSYAHSFSLDKTNIALTPFAYDSDITNIHMACAFWGPGRYVKDALNKLVINPSQTYTNDNPLRYQLCMRTEQQDTVYSKAVIGYQTAPTTNLSTTFDFNSGDVSPLLINSFDNTTGLIDSTVYPMVSSVQLQYPRPTTMEDSDDDTEIAFIYKGRTLPDINQGTGAVNYTESYSNNTGRVLLDYMTNNRYGLGSFITDINDTSALQHDHMINDLTLVINRANDQMNPVDDTGTRVSKPRYVFNGVIQDEGDKFETFSRILENCHSKFYYHNGYLRVYIDQPSEAIKVVNQTNARDIKFAGAATIPEINTIYVKFNNESKLFRQDMSFAETRELLVAGQPQSAREVITLGVTERGQAERHARWLLENEKYAKESVEYTAGADHAHIKPGDLITVTSTDFIGENHAGRLENIDNGTGKITLDQAIDFDVSKSYKILIDNGSTDDTLELVEVQIRLIGTPDSNGILSTDEIYFLSGKTTSDYGLDPIATGSYKGQAFQIINDSDAQGKYRKFTYQVIRKVELEDLTYKVLARRYNENRWDDIDLGFGFGFAMEETWNNTYTESG